MNNKSFLESINNEKLVEMIDKTLNFEKTQKQNNTKKILLRVIPIAAAIVLVIGLINILPLFHNADIDVAPTDPGANSATNPPAINTTEPIELFLPEQIEKSFFEERILEAVTDTWAFDKLSIYYKLSDSDNVYFLTPNTSKREKDMLLDYLYEYTDLTGDDMIQMLLNNNIPIPKNINPDYSHVRFGDDENTLLLDVEWHTYDTYMAEHVEPHVESLKQNNIESRNSDWYINLSDEEKEEQESHWQSFIDDYEKEANLIKEQKFYAPRFINGKNASPYLIYITNGYYDSNCRYIEDVVDISDHLDADGYYPYQVYPYYVFIDCFNEESEESIFYSSVVNSKREYDDYLINNDILPLFDDQLARGVITQEYYDRFIIQDPVEYYINMWF